MKKFLIICVLLTILPQAGFGEVYYPPTIYVKPDPYSQAAQGIGALLGALIQGAQQAKSQQEYEKWVQQTQTNLNELANGVTSFMRNSIGVNGVEATFNHLHNVLYSDGFTPSVNVSNGIAAITTTSVEGNSQFWSELSINMNTQQCRTVIKLSPSGIQAVSVSAFTMPQQQIQQQSNLKSAINFNYRKTDHLQRIFIVKRALIKSTL